MAEEALLLIEKGAGYIVDDVRAHERGLRGMLEADKKAYLEEREEVQRRGFEEYVRRVEEKRGVFVRGGGRGNDDEGGEMVDGGGSGQAAEGEEGEDGVEGKTVFENSSASSNSRPASTTTTAAAATTTATTTAAAAAATTVGMAANAAVYYPTPSTSHNIYHRRPDPADMQTAVPQPEKTRGYPLYKHLHENGYFLSPGLRFGCQYMAYPGDPLRFHSHFVVNGLGWDEEVEMRDVVGGGRLGTGVKKAWMVGGEDEAGEVRTFCVEWGGF